MEFSLNEGTDSLDSSHNNHTIIPHLLEIFVPVVCFLTCAIINKNPNSPSFKRIGDNLRSQYPIYSELRDDFRKSRCCSMLFSLPVLVDFLKKRYPFSETMLAFGVMFVVYELARALTSILYIYDTSVVYFNAQMIVEIQTDFGMGTFERDLQQWALGTPALVWVMNHFYKQSHWSMTSLVVCFFFTRRRDAFRIFRKWFILCNILAFAYYIVFPVAPPRLCPDMGVVDTILAYGSYSQKTLENGLVNKFAAMPSMHFGYSCMFAIAIIFLRPAPDSVFDLKAVLTTHQQLKYAVSVFLVCMYPLFMFLSIVITGNHFISDAIVGVLLVFFALGMVLASGNSKKIPLWMQQQQQQGYIQYHL